MYVYIHITNFTTRKQIASEIGRCYINKFVSDRDRCFKNTNDQKYAKTGEEIKKTESGKR